MTSLVAGVFDELRDDRTAWIVLAGVVSTVLARSGLAVERRRGAGTLVLVGLHALLAPIAGVLRAAGATAYRDVRLPTLIFAALAVVSAAGTLLFSVILPRIRLRAPRIVQDVTIGIVSLMAVIGVASRAGFNLSSIIATSAVLTAVIGFSLQDTLGNVIGGLALQTDSSIAVGDWIKVGDLSGKVVDIRWRYTAIETRNWETVIIPNGVLVKGNVTVLGRRRGEPLQWRRWVWFNVDFRHPPADVITAVETALRATPLEHVAAEPAPNCIVMDFTESFARYAVRYWLTDLAADDPTDSRVRARIYYALERASVPLSIPAHALFVTEESPERRERKAKEDAEKKTRALGSVDLFGQLPAAERERLAETLRWAPFARGEALTRQGAQAHWLYIITEGEAVVRVRVDDEEREVAALAPGDFMGEMSLLTGAPRAATVIAKTDVACWRLDKAAFQALLERRPELAEEVAETLASRQVELESVRENLSHDAKERRKLARRGDLSDRIRGYFGLDGPRSQRFTDV